MKAKLKFVAASFAFLTISNMNAAWGKAAVFSDLPFEQAKQSAQSEHKFLLLDFSASWCQPCKKMEITTWLDSTVENWIKENAIAIQIDVDKQEKLSSAFNITGMPTLVLFSPDNSEKEFDRQDGYLSASEIMKWLQGAKAGKSAKELEKELADTNEPAIWEHMGKARQFQTSNKNAEAFAEYLWLWDNLPQGDSQLGSLRASLVPSEIKRLLSVYPDGKAKIQELRDAADNATKRYDWMLLNGMLDENNKTLAWFDKAKTDAAQRDSLRSFTPLLEPVLFSNLRWADAATYLYPEPMKRIGEYFKNAQDMKKPRPDTEFAKDFDPFPNMVMLLYGAYVGANRDAEAKQIADECIRLDDTQTMRDVLKNMESGMLQARSAQKKTATK